MAGDPHQVSPTKSAVSLPIVVNANTDRIFEDVKLLQNIAPESDDGESNTYNGGVTPPGKFEHVANSGILKDKAVTNVQVKKLSTTPSNWNTKYIGKNGVFYSAGPSGMSILGSGNSLSANVSFGSDAYVIRDTFVSGYSNIIPSTRGFIGIRKQTYVSGGNTTLYIDEFDSGFNVINSKSVSVINANVSTWYLGMSESAQVFSDSPLVYGFDTSGGSTTLRFCISAGASPTAITDSHIYPTSFISGKSVSPFKPGPGVVVKFGGAVFFGFNGNTCISRAGLWYTGGALTAVSAAPYFSSYKDGDPSKGLGSFYYVFDTTSGNPSTFKIVITTDCGPLSPVTNTSSICCTFTTDSSVLASGFTVKTRTLVPSLNLGDSVVSECSASVGCSDNSLTYGPGGSISFEVFNNDTLLPGHPTVGRPLYPVENNPTRMLTPIVSNGQINGFCFNGVKRVGVDIGDCDFTSVPVDNYGRGGGYSMITGSINTLDSGTYLFSADKTAGYTAYLEWYESDVFLKTNLATKYCFNKANSTIVEDISYWNGRGFPDYNDAIPAKKVVATPRQSGRYRFGYIDIGEYIPNTSSGIALGSPSMDLDIYEDGVYAYSCYPGYPNKLFFDKSMDGAVYVPNTTLPLPGLTGYSAFSANSKNTTYMTGGFVGTEFNRFVDGFAIGNAIQVSGTTFTLFGSTYLFDGERIYGVNIDNGAVSFPLEIITSGRGLTYLCNSPERAWFLSSFDNSIYVFDGGRSLRKWRRFNGFDNITRGVYSVRDETLLLDAGSDWIWMRDGIITSNVKEADQVGNPFVSLFDTIYGIYIGGDSTFRGYAYKSSEIEDLTTSMTISTSIKPIDLQLPFYGLGNNRVGQFYRYAVAIWSETKAPVKITVTTYGFNQDGAKGFTNLNPVQRVVNVQTVDYDDSGYFRFSVDPAAQKGIASSLRIQSDDLISIYEVVLEYNDLGVQAIYAPGRKV